MAYRTVNVRPETYERLRMYQVGGKSLSDVIDGLMDEIEPASLYAKELKIHAKRVKEMREKGVGLTLDELDRNMARRRKT